MTTITPNTTASGAADLNQQGAKLLGQLIDIFDDQQNNAPEHRTYVLEAWDAILTEARALVAKIDSGAASAPVAPAPQPAPMPYPTDAQIDAVYEQTMSQHLRSQHLRSQDAPAVRRFGRAMFLCAWNAATEAAPVAPAPQPAVPKKKPLPDLMMASYHEAIGWNACVDAMHVAAAPKAAPKE